MYLSEAFLKESTELQCSAESITKKRINDKTIFLSHSSSDRDIARRIIAFLKKEGASIYVDWEDPTMSEKTNRETADKIKEAIGKRDFVFVLATENAMNSKWVPWEIGVGDEKLSSDKVLIIPVVNENTGYSGNEYMQLYNN